MTHYNWIHTCFIIQFHLKCLTWGSHVTHIHYVSLLVNKNFSWNDQVMEFRLWSTVSLFGPLLVQFEKMKEEQKWDSKNFMITWLPPPKSDLDQKVPGSFSPIIMFLPKLRSVDLNGLKRTSIRKEEFKVPIRPWLIRGAVMSSFGPVQDHGGSYQFRKTFSQCW